MALRKIVFGLGVAALGFSEVACSPGADTSTEEVRQNLETATQVSPLLGFSLDEAVQARHGFATLNWNVHPEGVVFTPSGTTTRLEWEFRFPDTASPDYRVEEVNAPCEGERVDTNTRLCDDRIEANLLLDLSTEDGSLAEEVKVVYKAFGVGDGEWAATSVPFHQFEGSFAMDVVDDSSEYPETLRLGLFGTSDGQTADGEFVADIVASTEGDPQEGAGTGKVLNVAEFESER